VIHHRRDSEDAAQPLVHWLVAACVLITAPVAIAMTRIDKGPTQDALYNLHKSFGV
jgi:cytochrome b561